MNIRSSRSGFSLVELLTVIAIIAILAAIIFPVMATVKEKGRQSKCMTNLHQIGVGMQMFKLDNRRYPAILCGPAEAGVPIDRLKGKDGQLFGEYVKSVKLFHCDSSQTQRPDTVVPFSLTPTVAAEAYTYDSYDVYVQGSRSEQHYKTNWAPGTDPVAAVDDANLLAYPPNDSAAQSDVALKKDDYERQLRWRTPPDDTVVTWCSYHESRPVAAPSGWKGRSLVLFLDGSTDSIPANEVGQCQWRTRPKKS